VEKVVENFSGDDGQSIVPQKTVQHLQQVFSAVGDDVAIEFGESQASFSSKDVKVSTKLVEGAYPNYRQVIPVSFSKKIEVPADSLNSAMQRISVVVQDSGAFVQLKFVKSKIEITTVGSQSQGLEEVPIDYDGPEIAVSFNPVFLSSPFKYLDADKVTMQLNDGYNPVALSCGDGFLYVIMPMRNK
jgi:DNA polymerase-3 subunit beta